MSDNNLMDQIGAVELKIQKMLLEKKSPRQITQNLLSNLQSPLTSIQEIIAILKFSLNSGIHQAFLPIVKTKLAAKEEIFWPWLLILIRKFLFLAPQSVADGWLEELKSQNQLTSILNTVDLSDLYSEWQKLRQQNDESLTTELSKQKFTLIQKLHFFKNDRMIREEKILLGQLVEIYPEDAEIRGFEQDFAERWARHILNDYVSLDSQLINEVNKQVAEEELLLQTLRSSILLQLKNHPETNYEFAMVFVFMNMDSIALEMLQMGPMTTAADWLKAELLLRCKRFVECLEHLVHLETQYGQNPETSFEVTYLRAQAFWGLNQPLRALELIQAIVKIRPSFRSARSLLRDWSPK